MALFICLTGSAQGQARLAPPINPATHRITYTAVVPVAHASQADLLLRAHAYTQRLSSANQPHLATTKGGSEEVRARISRPFAYIENGKAHVIALHFTTRIIAREGSYIYNLTDFDLVYPVNTQRAAASQAAETLYSGRTKATHDSFTEWLVTMRICFNEAAQEVQTQLQEEMSRPATQTGKK